MTGTYETHCPYCGSSNWRIVDTDYAEWTHIKIYLHLCIDCGRDWWDDWYE
jgi:hypothetical protein